MNRRTYGTGGSNVRPCQPSITSGLDTPMPAKTRPGASDASVANPIAVSTGPRVAIGTDAAADRDPSVDDGDGAQQRHRLGALHLAADDRVEAAVLGQSGELDQPLHGEPFLDRDADADPHRSRKAATRSLWSSVVRAGPSGRRSFPWTPAP